MDKRDPGGVEVPATPQFVPPQFVPTELCHERDLGFRTELKTPLRVWERPQRIEIRAVLNGFIVSVGCTDVCFQSTRGYGDVEINPLVDAYSKMETYLRRYLMDPEAETEAWRKTFLYRSSRRIEDEQPAPDTEG